MPSALNLSTIEPGDYPCEWHVSDSDGEVQTHAGTVDLEASRSPTGTVHGVAGTWITHPESGETSGAFPQYLDFPLLRGRLVNQGLDIALIGAQITIMGSEVSWVRASAAVVGVELPPSDEFRFLGAEVQITALDVLGGQTPLETIRYPTKDWAGGEWTVQGNGDSKQVWADSEIEVSHEYNMTARMHDPYEFRLRYIPLMRFNKHSPIGIQAWIDLWIEPLRDVASLATGRTERITYLGLLPDLHADGRLDAVAQLFAAGISQEVYHSNKDNGARVGAALEFSKVSPIDLIRASREARSAGNPLLQTYRPGMMDQDQHPRGRYLFAMQCLESLHGFENQEAIRSNQRSHNLKRWNFFQHLDSTRKLEGTSLTGKDWKFAKSALGRRATSGLDTALKQLIEMLPSSSVQVELDALALVAEVRAAVLEEDSTAEPPVPENVLRMVRNDLAHGTRDHPANSLASASEVLHRIIRAHLLRVLGCGHEEQQRALKSERR